MKIFAFATLGVAVLLAGCASMSSRMHDRFSPVPPHTRIFGAEPKVVYEAGQQALKNLSLLVGRKSLAEGRIEGYAPIRPGDATSDTRQTTIEILLSEAVPGQTQVALLVWDRTEGSFPGGVSEQALREHSLYEMYFAALQQVLLENGALKTVGKP